MVPKISFGSPIVAACRKEFPDTIFDVKLGIFEPERRIPDFVKAGADIISVCFVVGGGGWVGRVGGSVAQFSVPIVCAILWEGGGGQA